MSDDIRVYSGWGGEREGDPRRRRTEALKRFKRGRKAGDLVRGVFLRLEPVPPGTAWVSLEGAALLAALPDDLADLARRIAAGQGAGATPTGVTEADFPIKNGQTCHFILEAVEPEPVLRMLGASDAQSLAATAAEARWHGLVRLPLTQLAALYARQRSLLDQILHRDLWIQKDLDIPFPASLPPALTDFVAAAKERPAPESPQGRYSSFITRGEARGYFETLETYRLALLENLRPYGLMGFFFVPWLCPAAFGLELAFTCLPRRNAADNADSDPSRAIQGANCKLQGLFAGGYAQAISPAGYGAMRRELHGSVGGSFTQRSPSVNEPDLLSQILALKPEEARAAFNRKA